MSETVRRRWRWGRIAVGVVWLGLLVLVLWSSRDWTLSDVAAAGEAAGIWGGVLYMVAFALLQPIGLSAHILILASALVWPWWWAIPLSLVGAVACSLTSYAIARYVAYDWVQARIPKRLRAWEDRLDSLWGVIVFRVLTFTTPPAQLMMGTVQVRFSTLLLGTAIGFLPQICVDVLLGGQLLSWLFG